MIAILILVVLVAILIKLCHKPREKFTAADYISGGYNRVALGLFATLGSIEVPLFWVLTVLLFSSAIAFFRHAKKIRAKEAELAHFIASQN